jgi:ribosomal protein S27AE
MHNAAPPPSYSQIMRRLSAELLEQKVKEGEYTSVKEEKRSCPSCGAGSIRSRASKKPRYVCQQCRSEFEEPNFEIIDTGRIPKEEWNSFWAKYGPGIKARSLEEQKQLEENSLSTGSFIALCNRCHMAARSGLVLCPVCRHGYKRQGRSMCWGCFKETAEGKEIAKRYEKQELKHPWCGRIFSVEGQWLELLSEPLTCCSELCDVGYDKCPEAQKRMELDREGIKS